MTTFTVHTEDQEQLNAVKAILNALKIKFEMNLGEKPYNLDFVSKINKSQEEYKEGRFVRVEKDGLGEFLGL